MLRTTCRVSEAHYYNYNQESQDAVLRARNTYALNCLQKRHKEGWRSAQLRSGNSHPISFYFILFLR